MLYGVSANQHDANDCDLDTTNVPDILQDNVHINSWTEEQFCGRGPAKDQLYNNSYTAAVHKIINIQYM